MFIETSFSNESDLERAVRQLRERLSRLDKSGLRNVAARTRVGVRTLCSIADGETKNPTLNTVLAIARALGETVSGIIEPERMRSYTARIVLRRVSRRASRPSRFRKAA